MHRTRIPVAKLPGTTGTYSSFWSTTGVGVHHSQSATWNHCFEWSFVCEDGTRYIDVGHQKVALANLIYSGTGSGIRLFFFGWSHGIIWHCTALYSYVRIETSGTRYQVWELYMAVVYRYTNLGATFQEHPEGFIRVRCSLGSVCLSSPDYLR